MLIEERPTEDMGFVLAYRQGDVLSLFRTRRKPSMEARLETSMFQTVLNKDRAPPRLVQNHPDGSIFLLFDGSPALNSRRLGRVLTSGTVCFRDETCRASMDGLWRVPEVSTRPSPARPGEKAEAS